MHSQTFPLATSGLRLGLTTGKEPWKRIRVLLHEASEPHITASLKWCSFQESVRTGTIITKIAEISREDILNNRHYIKSVAQVVVLCSVQDIALRGHREGCLVDSSGHCVELDFNCGNRNRGNFLEILSSYAIHDPIIKRKLMSGSSHTQHTHHSIQDQLLSLPPFKVCSYRHPFESEVSEILCYPVR